MAQATITADAPPAKLAIEHVEESSPPAFKLTRLPDGKSAAPVPIVVRLSIDQGFAALTQFLAACAWRSRNFREAARLYTHLAQHCAARGHSEGEAAAYHQPKIIGGQRRDFAAAREWCLKALAITEKLGIEHGAALTYHQLGMIACEERDFGPAREWYLKSLAIFEKLGIEYGAAYTYHRLGVIAYEARDFGAAREWYHKSLAIEERHGNLHDAAGTYGSLGILAGLQGNLRNLVDG